MTVRIDRLAPVIGLAAALLAASCAQGSSVAENPAPAASSSRPLVDVFAEVVAPAGTPVPRFKADAAWPNVPDDMMLGQVAGVAVDANDDVWLVQRPGSLTATDSGLQQNPPIAKCCRAAKPVVQFSKDGNFISEWGGPEIAPDIDGVNQWPLSVHGVYVDEKETVWFGGNGDGDHAVLNYSADGKFIKAYGKRGSTGGNLDRGQLGNPADVLHDSVTNELLIADGYINKRVMGFDSSTGAFSRFWGADGKAPDAPTRDGDFDVSQATSNADGGANPQSPMFGDIVHCIVKTRDNHYYVCDRRNNRAQLFRKNEAGEIEFVQTIAIAPETGGTRTVTDIAFSPDEKYVYVADMMNGRIWILLRETHEVLGSIGRNGRYPGEFIWLHSIDTDSEGNIYTSEVNTGRRVQKLVFTGFE